MATARQQLPADVPHASPSGPETNARSLTAQDPLSIDDRFEALLRQVQADRPSEDVSLIRKAWEFCVQHHQGQMRASGEPYIIHPLEVAQVLAEMKMDSTAIAAGLLHDAVEDTPATNEEIESGFGDQVAHIVEGVTKIDKIQFANREDRQAENVRKMLLAMVSDVRVVLIKLADRLHNMRTLEHLSPSAAKPLPAKRSTSMPPWPTVSAWAKCAASSKTWPFAIPIPSASNSFRRRRGPPHRGRAVPARC